MIDPKLKTLLCVVKEGSYTKAADVLALSQPAVSYHLRQLEEEAFFDEDEQEIIRRGRNATIHTKAKNADIMTYRHATALEAVIGYLYLYHKSERLELLWQAMVRIGETV